jgi:hypothetical protein
VLIETLYCYCQHNSLQWPIAQYQNPHCGPQTRIRFPCTSTQHIVRLPSVPHSAGRAESDLCNGLQHRIRSLVVAHSAELDLPQWSTARNQPQWRIRFSPVAHSAESDSPQWFTAENQILHSGQQWRIRFLIIAHSSKLDFPQWSRVQNQRIRFPTVAHSA